MTEIRPISLCNVGYKIISKVLCQRLKACLPALISETQSAFVPGRLISDNILIAQEMFHGLRTNKSCQGKIMAIKTDMSKAYDRVEWNFIEALLSKMGFAAHWIQLMMGCISTVQYKVLLNGQPKGHIIPQRGLRQGDPLSPYLFHMCTEALVANIKKAERGKLLTGIKVARACPPISHLLFADDSLFFCRAQKEECQTILRILKEYEAVSGQQINFEKSSIQFGHKIEESMKQDLRDVLGIQNLGGMGSYLGIPENLGGPKTQVFGNTRGMHWQSWDKVCSPKEDGGLGFKDFTDFNTAMLGKQLWRLIEKPNSLFSRVFKGRVGTGSSISVWNDPWLPSTRPRPANKNNHTLYPELTVDALIDATSRTWNVQAIRTLVDPLDAKIIETLPLSRSRLDDRDGWHFTMNGKYTVKSGYQVERVYPDRDRTLPIYGPSISTLKAFCWKIKCPPKMKHFLWQLLSGCIAVKKNLKARGLKGDIICDRCGAPEDSINHVFFECPPAIQIWALSKIPTNPAIFPTHALFTNMDHLFWRVQPALEDHQFAWILWYIWKARNNKVFTNMDIDPLETLKLAEREALLWAEAQVSLTKGTYSTIAPPQVTIPTNPGRWCFTDGSWKDQDNFSGQGWYSTLEGFDGLMGARNTRATTSPLHSEMEALIWAMECN
ncbi:uncharacterized protein LOC130499090 [Raphanus sativus]|uniref:Uncharacterized protein LOC130499090 n=1 Tax=Raphanus sativus TaxID=3726 RepID=A0A9W3CBJ5_RAPSA|nr:uncharacterized protein LOC130499090 [Raphanus sativus]